MRQVTHGQEQTQLRGRETPHVARQEQRPSGKDGRGGWCQSVDHRCSLRWSRSANARRCEAYREVHKRHRATRGLARSVHWSDVAGADVPARTPHQREPSCRGCEVMSSPPSASSPPEPPTGSAARSAPISWRNIRVWRAGTIVQAPTRLRVLRHIRNHGFLPEGYELEPAKGWAIDFMGFDTDEQGE